MKNRSNSKIKVKAVVDRIEGDLAVLEVEGKAEIIWPLEFLPKKARLGNILDFDILQNMGAEKKQKEKIRELKKRLSKRS